MSEVLPQQLLDWGACAPLRLRAKQLAHGMYAGSHRSARRGPGIEFDGHRDYVPGDDLRRLDYRALMRHDRLLVRQFETETERSLCLAIDATESMRYRSGSAPAAKYAYAALLAAALARITLRVADNVALDWVGGQTASALPRMGGNEAFERLIGALESVVLGGDDELTERHFEHLMHRIAGRAKRGSVVVLLSDLIDLPPSAPASFAALGNRDRIVVAVRVLDPVEATFPFRGTLRLRPSHGGEVVETDAQQARSGYLAALRQQFETWNEPLLGHGGRLIDCQTSEPPIEVLRRIVQAIGGQR